MSRLSKWRQRRAERRAWGGALYPDSLTPAPSRAVDRPDPVDRDPRTTEPPAKLCDRLRTQRGVGLCYAGPEGWCWYCGS